VGSPLAFGAVAFAAVLDACVLYPVGVRDLLLSVAEQEVFVPYWSKDILAEMSRNVVKDRKATPELMEAICAQMERAFPAALIEGYVPLIPAMTNDPKDRHVLAAAVRAHVGLIVTDNVKDFPAAACTPYEVEIQRADEFLSNSLDHDPEAVMRAVRVMARKRRNPPTTEKELLTLLERAVPVFAVEAEHLL